MKFVSITVFWKKEHIIGLSSAELAQKVVKFKFRQGHLNGVCGGEFLSL